MTIFTPLEFAQQLIRNNRHLDASHVLEANLLMQESDVVSRLLLAQTYIVLKENHYRARARHHLERIIEDGAPPEIFRIALNFLIKNVYLTNGPSEKAKSLFERYLDYFSDADRQVISGQINTIENYLRIGKYQIRSSSPPELLSDVQNNDLALKAYIFKEFNEQVVEKNHEGSYFTFGSCFAGNLARSMRSSGLNVDSFWVGEEVNTTFSNVNLLKFILGKDFGHKEYYESVMAGQDVGRLRSNLISAKNVIYTMGMALSFFEDGAKYTPHHPGNLKTLLRNAKYTYRFSTVDENVGQLEEVGWLLRRHTEVRNIFLTVSPVPLAASLRSLSAAVDDSESKAILRSAAGVICRADPELFTYYPSFEAFRWLPCFQDQSAFGRDDGGLRHANSAVVDEVVSIFLKSVKTKAVTLSPA